MPEAGRYFEMQRLLMKMNLARVVGAAVAAVTTAFVAAAIAWLFSSSEPLLPLLGITLTILLAACIVFGLLVVLRRIRSLQHDVQKCLQKIEHTAASMQRFRNISQEGFESLSFSIAKLEGSFSRANLEQVDVDVPDSSPRQYGVTSVAAQYGDRQQSTAIGRIGAAVTDDPETPIKRYRLGLDLQNKPELLVLAGSSINSELTAVADLTVIRPFETVPDEALDRTAALVVTADALVEGPWSGASEATGSVLARDLLNKIIHSNGRNVLTVYATSDVRHGHFDHMFRENCKAVISGRQRENDVHTRWSRVIESVLATRAEELL